MKISCYHLVATDEARAKLKTKGSAGTLDCLFTREKITMVNYPIDLFVRLIDLTQPNSIVNATGIKGNIDITIRIDVNAPRHLMLRHWQKALRANGLDLVEAATEERMPVEKAGSIRW